MKLAGELVVMKRDDYECRTRSTTGFSWIGFCDALACTPAAATTGVEGIIMLVKYKN